MVNEFALFVGQVVVCLGGACLGLAIIGFIGWLAGMAWILFSDNFRNICKAESLIFEYRKNRTEFMAWKGLKEIEDGK